ncbi:AAA family ATPase [Nocardioides ungokensis]|uniref:AAA family ATPase n=1 Tax=Nocardioides ungokensis TaxID=1643322 RepID=UPI001FE81BDE|nr:AAA family ATPase [Nocardioides ungokensis]
MVAEGIELAPGVTFLVGENGSGKSTLVEGIAMAFGLSPEAARHRDTTPHGPRSPTSAGCCDRPRPRVQPVGGSSSGPRRCTAGTPTSRTTRPRTTRASTR